jgi:hypothetical protein
MSLLRGKSALLPFTNTSRTNRFYSKIRTPDMGGNATNQEFTRAILASMEKSL